MEANFFTKEGLREKTGLSREKKERASEKAV